MRLGASIVIVVIVSMLWAFSWKIDDVDLDLAKRLLPPSLSHPLGSDSLGRDLLALIQLAVRDSVIPIWLSIIASFLMAIAAAVFSIAFFNQKLTDNRLFLSIIFLISALPVVILTFVLGILREQIDGRSVCLSLGFVVFFQVYLSVLQSFQKSKNLAFWDGDRAIGGNFIMRIIRLGLMQEWRHALKAQLLFCLSAGVAIETSLSYIGFGFQDPDISLGAILSAHFVQALQGNLHIIIVSVFAIGLVMAFPYCLMAIIVASRFQLRYLWAN